VSLQAYQIKILLPSYSGYLHILRPFWTHAVWCIALSGCLGLSVQLSLLQDLLSMMTLHIYCFYVYAARLVLSPSSSPSPANFLSPPDSTTFSSAVFHPFGVFSVARNGTCFASALIPSHMEWIGCLWARSSSLSSSSCYQQL
jgi:hypothetical protein